MAVCSTAPGNVTSGAGGEDVGEGEAPRQPARQAKTAGRQTRIRPRISGRGGPEKRVDKERRPDEGLEEPPDAAPEPVRRLDVVHGGADEAEEVDATERRAVSPAHAGAATARLLSLTCAQSGETRPPHDRTTPTTERPPL